MSYRYYLPWRVIVGIKLYNGVMTLIQDLAHGRCSRKQLPFFSPLPLLVFALRDYTVMLEGESQPPSPSRVECLSFLMIQFGRPAPQMPVNPGHVWAGSQVLGAPSPLGSLPVAASVVSGAFQKMSSAEGQSGCACGREGWQSPGWAWQLDNTSL